MLSDVKIIDKDRIIVHNLEEETREAEISDVYFCGMVLAVGFSGQNCFCEHLNCTTWPQEPTNTIIDELSTIS